MIEFWKSLSGVTRFSVISFFVTGTLGLLSMGALGLGLYYPVAFLFKKYPSLNDWTGDWVWPAIITVGMLWSVGFIFGGVASHYLVRFTSSKLILCADYVLILWLWAAILWYFTLKSNL